jgi:serine/threonine-protein kinase
MTQPAGEGRIGPYRLIRRLGEGGMGVVHLAYDEGLGRRVALKLLRLATPAMRERLEREAHLHARVEHPAVCRLYQVGEHEGWPYLVMQYIEGETADRALAQAPLDVVLRAFVELADGVHAAHLQGLIHRDLKPGNLMVARDEAGGLHPYVMDFGLARDDASGSLTDAGVILGSPAYMAPEQIAGGWVDPRTDVYGLGASLFEVLAGRPPYLAESPAQAIARIQTEDPPLLRTLRPDLPRTLETILATTLARDPARRYPSAAAFRDDLKRLLSGQPILARRPSLPERLALRAGRNRLASGLLLGIAGLGIALGVTWVVLRQRAQSQAYWAQRFGQEVLRMDSVLRFGRMLPPHDVARELAQVRLRMEEIRSQMGANRLSQGPGHLALGEGHLILGEVDAARWELDAAWAMGFRPAEASLALGRCLGLQYQASYAATLGTLDPAKRHDQQEEARRALLRPAVAHLAKARTELGSLTLEDQARLALVEDHFDEAERCARSVRAAEPWRYDTTFLLAKARAMRGRELLDAGRTPEGLTDLEAALALVDEAQGVAPSDDRLEDVKRFVWLLGAAHRLGGLTPLEAQTRSVAAAERMLALNSTRVDMFHTVALSYGQLGKRLAAAGKDPEPLFRKAESLMRGVVEAPPGRYPNPVRGKAFERLANLAYQRAQLDQEHHRNPEIRIAEGLAFCRQALSEGLAQWETHQTRAFLEMVRAEHLEGLGRDSREALQQAAAGLRDCANLNPSAASYTNLAEILLRHGRACETHGGDPDSSLAEARQSLERSLAINPENPTAFGLEADLALLDARLAWSRGLDPAPLLQRGLAWIERALKIAPEEADHHATRSLLYTLQADLLDSVGGNSSLARREARESARRALALGATPTPALRAARVNR